MAGVTEVPDELPNDVISDVMAGVTDVPDELPKTVQQQRCVQYL